MIPTNTGEQRIPKLQVAFFKWYRYLSQNLSQLFHIVKCPWLRIPLLWKNTSDNTAHRVNNHQNNFYKFWLLVFTTLLNEAFIEHGQWLWWVKFKAGSLIDKDQKSGSLEGLQYSSISKIIKDFICKITLSLSPIGLR